MNMKRAKTIDDTHLWELKKLWEEKRRALGIPEPPTDLAAIDREYRHRRLQQRGPVTPREIGYYAAFTSTNPRLRFAFHYPSDWQVREFDEEGYGEVFILGPRDRENTYNLALVVSVTPGKAQGGRFATLEEMVANRLSRSQRLTEFEVLSRVKGELASAEAVELMISHKMPLPLAGNRQEVPLLERWIIAARKGWFYELIYRVTAEDYYTYLDAFQTLVRTFEFLDERRDAHIFYPLVTRVPAYAVGEEQVGYEPT